MALTKLGAQTCGFFGLGARLRQAELLCSAVLILLLVVSASRASAQPVSDYRIGPRDVVHLTVLEEPTLGGDYPVAESGHINHPTLGYVLLDGLTEAQAEDKVLELLEDKVFKEGQVSFTLEVLQSRSNPIHVLGAVNKPNRLESSRAWTLVEALTEAGGPNGRQGNVLYILRTAPNGLTDQLEVAFDDVWVRADPRLNVPLAANDVVRLPEAVDIIIHCTGQVAEPGAIVFKSHERPTLLKAIARAGGLTRNAKRKLLIKRELPNGLFEDITVNYRDIVANRRPDIDLQRGDVIVVGESFL